MSESITIELKSGSKSILKFGFIFRASLVLFMVIGCGSWGILVLRDSIVGALILFAIMLFLFVVFYKMLNSVFFKEKIIVTKEELRITLKNASSYKEKVVALNDIKRFGFADQHYTKNAMDNPIIDITGLQTSEREMQYVINEGNIMVETEDEKFRFGKNMPSWDVEEVVEQVENFTGRKFAKARRETSADNLEIETEIDPDAIPDTDDMTEEEVVQEQEDPNIVYTEHTYTCDEGEMMIKQKKDAPAADDKAFLNGRPAPTGKYHIGDKTYIMVSNGLIYAVRKQL